LQRQNSQLQSAASRRRQSTSVAPSSSSSDDLNAQLASKSDTISSLELEISKLNSKLSAAQSANDAQSSRITALESQIEKAESEAASAVKELADLKANLDKASEAAKADGSARSSAETQLAQLEAELGTAKRSHEAAAKRAETLEKKIETLTTLHRESDSRNQAKIADGQKQERDAKELRARVTALSNENGRLRDENQRRKKLEASGDAAGLEELEDEERERLRSQVRQLEEEVFELRRGVWRDKRRELQPGLDDGFDDVDLSSTSPATRKPPAHSTFQDVIQSGISAFTGATNRRNSNAHGRKQSLGLLDDDEDFAFDEDAFRKAQEDEAMSRLERVKEVKRGLKKWEGWRVDIADLRTGMGGVFEV
jgi:archaellum component FlaC